MNVFAVATVLHFEDDPGSVEAWEMIELAFRQSGLEMQGLLHFSWHVAYLYNSEQIEDCLQEAARDLSLILTTSTGLGIFPSEQPVLYLPVMKTQPITDLHKRLWKRLRPIAVDVNPYYDPERWIPHITLAHENVVPERISQATARLLQHELTFRFQIDHLALIFRNGSENGTVMKIPFGRLS